MNLTFNPPFTPKTLIRFPSPPIRRRNRKISHKGDAFRASSLSNGDGSADFSWEKVSRSIQRGADRFFSNFEESLKKETGIDLKSANVKARELVGKIGEAVNRFRLELVPEFVEWNKWDQWKDIEKWEPKRIGALILYIIIVTISCQRVYLAVTTHIDRRNRKELTETYMEALIPEPSPSNVRKFKKGIWRKTMPKGLKIKKFIEGPGGTLIQDNSYVGEDAWDNDPEPSQDAVANIIDKDTKLSNELKKELKETLRISGLAIYCRIGYRFGASLILSRTWSI